MSDLRTIRVERAGEDADFSEYLAGHEVVLILVSSDAAGTEFAIDRDVLSIGRGPGVDIAVEENSLSRQHATLSYGEGTFRVRDLGSTNGTFVNGSQVESAELKHGDRLELGQCAFQLVIEARKKSSKAYVVDDA